VSCRAWVSGRGEGPRKLILRFIRAKATKHQASLKSSSLIKTLAFYRTEYKPARLNNREPPLHQTGYLLYTVIECLSELNSLDTWEAGV